MSSFRVSEAVAATAKNLPSRSPGVKRRSSSSIFPASAHSRTWLLASIATTWRRAPVSMSPPILGSPTFPAPTTRHCVPVSFINIGNRLVTVTSRGLCQASNPHRRCIARDCVHRLARKEFAQLRVGVPGKELTQVFACFTRGEILLQQPFDRIWDLSRRASVSYGPRGRLMQTERSADAEVIGIDQTSINFHLLAVDAKVGNPVLTATVRASGDVQFQVLIEAGQAFFQFFHQPAGKALGLGDRELAEFRAAAGDGA